MGTILQHQPTDAHEYQQHQRMASQYTFLTTALRHGFSPPQLITSPYAPGSLCMCACMPISTTASPPRSSSRAQ